MTNDLSGYGDPTGLGYRPCVGIILLNREGLVWIGCRADHQNEAEGRGAWWQMPQGGIENGEAPEAAAHRELFEETGIRSTKIVAERPQWLKYDLPPDLVGKAWGGRYRGQTLKWFVMRFLGSDNEVNIAPPAGQSAEFVDWKWAPFADVPRLIVPFKRAIYDVLFEDFSALAVPHRC